MKRTALAAGLIVSLAASLPRPARAKEAVQEDASSKASAGAGKAGIRWVPIPGGTFTMGSSSFGPPHHVTVKSFQMAKTLVTNKQYKACVAAGACTAAHVSGKSCAVYNGSSWAPGDLPDSAQGDDHPVVCVDWNQAKAFCAWAGGRLPSEAQWEYAARSGGKNRKYPWGNATATCADAVIGGCGYHATAAVCSKTAGNTKQGLCDMAGNAWEWVEDWWHDSYTGAPTDGSAWEDAGDSRIGRGGSWSVDAAITRSADRTGFDPSARYDGLGFRPVR
ncbi:MAG: formylglycine-generating enzyme family protein [Elusimicrobia bacterium]|nr:formylglycine-generating enzyme family protein [Elusimicrobiota bacterium]